MTKVKQSKPGDVWYKFEDEVDINYEVNNKTIVIAGNREFTEFGDDDLIKVVKGNYYDDDKMLIDQEDGTCYEDVIGYDYDTAEELEKLSGKKGWVEGTLKGYSQGDWQTIWYVKDEVSADRISDIENFYMGKVSEFSVFEDDDKYGYTAYVPDDIVWKGKAAICDALGLDPNDTEVYDENEEKVE